jgi:hypothetical protein
MKRASVARCLNQWSHRARLRIGARKMLS